MGAPKMKWTSEEEEALKAGVAKHGTGKWKNIQKDPEFVHCLASRSNIDLKDKWRNMSVSASTLGPRDKQRTPKPKALPAPSSPSTFQNNPAAIQAPEDNTSVDAAKDSPKSIPEAKNPPVYYPLIFEALSTIKDPNGSDIDTICSFIKQRHTVPQNFRRLISSKFKRLVVQNKLEMVQNRYKLKKGMAFGNRTSTSKQKDARPKQSQNTGSADPNDTIEEAALTAAYRIAEAENKSFVASEAVKEAERVAKMAEESDAVLQLAKEIFEQCLRGEIVMMA